MAAGNDIEGSPFLRQLTSSDIPTRQEAFRTLRAYLHRSPQFSSLELLKLWKGLFHCMWMTANPKPQQRLASDYASLVTDTLQKGNVMPFVDAFWVTMAREWPEIDYQRMDKYLRLVRFMLRATLQRIATDGFSGGLVRAQNETMERTPLSVGDVKVANGLRYHVLDIFVDELETVKEKAGDKMSAEIIEELLQPVVKIHEESAEKPVRRRAAEALNDELLIEWDVHVAPKKPVEAEEDDDDEFGGFGD